MTGRCTRWKRRSLRNEGRLKVLKLESNFFLAEEIIEKIDPNTLVFGISLMFSSEWFGHRSLIKEIKKKYPKIIIVAGGEHPSAAPEYILKRFVWGVPPQIMWTPRIFSI